MSRTSLPPAGAEGVAAAVGSCGSGKAAGEAAVNAKELEAMSIRDFERNMTCASAEMSGSGLSILERSPPNICGKLTSRFHRVLYLSFAGTDFSR